MISSLPADALIEKIGPSTLGTGMIEVSWQRQLYAVFEKDLTIRATLQPSRHANQN